MVRISICWFPILSWDFLFPKVFSWIFENKHAVVRPTSALPGSRLSPYSRGSSFFAVNRQQVTEMHLSATQSIYSLPAMYDLAFGYRDFYEEVIFLLSRHTKIVGTCPQTILEVAAGPSRHSITALLLQLDDAETFQPSSVYCIDSSPEMAIYAKQIALGELANRPSPPASSSFLSSNFHYQVADMRNFTLNSQINKLPTNKTSSVLVDTIWVLLGSLQHMLTNQDVIDCFEAMYRTLVSNGTVFIELPHPREATFNMIECTRNGWKVPLYHKDGNTSLLQFEDDNDDIIKESELSIIWGDDGDEFDPITQIRNFSIRFDLLEQEGAFRGVERSDDKIVGVSPTATSEVNSRRSTHEIVPMRLFTAQEIDALARCAGFEVVAMFGALEEGVSVNDEDTSYRLVSVLRKQRRA